MLELEVEATATDVLDQCRRLGVTVRSERRLAGHGGGRHWHLGFPDRPGTLELSEAGGRVWLKVHPLRDGGWAKRTAEEIAGRSARRS